MGDAEVVRMGQEWVVCDDGLSHNGTFVNGERVRGRRRLEAGDAITVGSTTIAFQGAAPTHDPTRGGRPSADPVPVTPAQRRLLDALSFRREK